MDDFDEADLDGDGEFDGIDIAFLEEDEERNSSKQHRGQGTGCCVPFLIIGTSITGAVFIIQDIIA